MDLAGWLVLGIFVVGIGGSLAGAMTVRRRQRQRRRPGGRVPFSDVARTTWPGESDGPPPPPPDQVEIRDP